MSEREFPKAKFRVCIDELGEVIVDKPIAFIKTVTHYHTRPPLYRIFMCKSQSCLITSRELINCLIENNYCPNRDECMFLEKFSVDDDGVVIPFFGS